MNLDYDRYDEPGPHDFIDSLSEKGYIHESEVPDVSEARHAIRSIVEALYITGDVTDLEDGLHELCESLNIPFQLGTPKMQTKPMNWDKYLKMNIS